jgi:hypothetical protein
MDDKTSSRPQPSTTFDDSFSSTTHSLVRPLTSSPTYSSTFNTYLPGVNQLVGMEHEETFDVRNSLLSPPEAIPHDSFPRTLSTSSMDFKMTGPSMAIVKAHQPMTPPISPASKNSLPEVSPSEVRDPILYPHSDPSPQTPLFRDTDTQQVVDEHVAARETTSFKNRSVSPPRHSEYQLALEFKSQVAQVFNANRRLWAQRELAQLREDNLLKMGGRRYTTIAPATGIRVIKPPKPSRQSGVKNGVSKPPRVSKPLIIRNGTPDAGKRVAREDKDFSSLPDYCPPVSSLPNKPNSLKVDWKGAPIDLKFDPHAHLLHPDEIYLAANLRLDCATYLTSKRRIFIKRIEAYKIGKEFRKTDAQQACKIDVNKASKLWQAFDRVGWLHPKWITKFV